MMKPLYAEELEHDDQAAVEPPEPDDMVQLLTERVDQLQDIAADLWDAIDATEQLRQEAVGIETRLRRPVAGTDLFGVRAGEQRARLQALTRRAFRYDFDRQEPK